MVSRKCRDYGGGGGVSERAVLMDSIEFWSKLIAGLVIQLLRFN